MKPLIKSILLILTGVLIASALLYGYSRFFNSSDDSLQFVPVEPGNAVISRISGEVYIIREERILTPRAGDAIREGDVLKVVDDSWCQVHISGKATMNIRSNTLLKVQRLLTGTKDIDIRTELLTGSMIYKVDRLEASDRLEVLAQKKIYRVEGTEFMVEAFGDGSRVAVREGHVAVLDESDVLLESLNAGRSLSLRGWQEGSALPETEELDARDKRIFDQETPLFRSDGKTMVYLEILSEPEGAQLYLDGRLNGRQSLSGLFPADSELKILARKRGFADAALTVKPGSLRSSRVLLKLEPLSLEESLLDEAERPEEPSLEELMTRAREGEAQLAELSRQSSGLRRDLETMKADNSSLMREKEDLEKELERSLAEQEKLRKLLIQIQELSADQ